MQDVWAESQRVYAGWLRKMEVQMMKTVVERYHGLGNDYLVFDPNKNELKLNRET